MAKKSQIRWIVIVGLAATAVALLTFLLWPRPLQVDVARAVEGPISETVSDQGAARVRNAYVVAAPASGRLERLSLKVGDRVRAGEALAYVRAASPDLLDPRTQAERSAAVASASAAVTAARAQRDSTVAQAQHAALQLSRTTALAAQGFATKQVLDDAQAQDRAARAALAQSEAMIRARVEDLAAARAALIGPQASSSQGVAARSPVSGWVTHVLQESERTIAMGTPILEVSDSGQLEAQIEFLSQDAVRIRPGMDAEIYDWGGPGVIPARVRLIEPQGYLKISALGVEEQRALVMLEFTGRREAWATLGPGYRVWGRVYLRRDPKVLKVPLGALVRDQGHWAVYRLQAGHARLTPIGVGVMTDQEAEVTSGLALTDPVIVYPSDQVHDGAAVRPRRIPPR